MRECQSLIEWAGLRSRDGSVRGPYSNQVQTSSVVGLTRRFESDLPHSVPQFNWQNSCPVIEQENSTLRVRVSSAPLEWWTNSKSLSRSLRECECKSHSFLSRIFLYQRIYKENVILDKSKIASCRDERRTRYSIRLLLINSRKLKTESKDVQVQNEIKSLESPAHGVIFLNRQSLLIVYDIWKR